MSPPSTLYVNRITFIKPAGPVPIYPDDRAYASSPAMSQPTGGFDPWPLACYAERASAPLGQNGQYPPVRYTTRLTEARSPPR